MPRGGCSDQRHGWRVVEYDLPLRWEDGLDVAIQEGRTEDKVNGEARDNQERDTRQKRTDSDEQGDLP